MAGDGKKKQLSIRFPVDVVDLIVNFRSGQPAWDGLGLGPKVIAMIRELCNLKAAATSDKAADDTAVNEGLRYVVMAAIGDLPSLNGRPIGRAIAWLVKYALERIYGDRLTFARFIALALEDENNDWASAEDPLEGLAEAALLEAKLIERLMLGRAVPTAEQYSALAGALRVDVDWLAALPTWLAENGDVKERVSAD